MQQTRLLPPLPGRLVPRLGSQAGRRLAALAAALLGAGIVVAIFGVAMLNPFNVGWMQAGPLGPDPTQYWLGWRFFAQAPWSWPPGANPDYGMEINSAIFFADAIPLLALPLKLLAPWLPQYWGLWLMLCGALQGWLGWVLMGRATPNPWAKLLGAGLFVLQPMLLTRMGGHLALAGQWTVLAALALALRRGQAPFRQGPAWVALLAVTALVHAYLLAMVAAIWGADWLRRVFVGGRGGGGRSGGGRGGEKGGGGKRDGGEGEPGWRGPGWLKLRRFAPGWFGPRWPRRLLARGAEAAFGLGATALALWAAGFFMLPGGFGAPGYGGMMLDLFAPLDPAPWGAFLPDLPDLRHPESGGVYLGLGGILLLAGGAVCAALQPSARHRAGLRHGWPLLLALLALTAFAITNHMTLLGHVLVLFEPPAVLQRAASTLRASERFVWPLLYLLLVVSAAAMARRLGGARTGLVLAVLLAVQVADLRPRLGFLRGLMADAQAQGEPRFDAFWDQAARRYTRLRAVPAANQGERWKDIASIAARHRMATDAVYLARADEDAVAALARRVAALLAARRFEPGTLYVLRDAASLELARQVADPARDLLTRVDGMDVLAPGWFGVEGLVPGRFDMDRMAPG